MNYRAVYKCHGGKWPIRRWLISHFPQDYASLKYAEPCGGAASALLAKAASVEEVYNDADPRIANIFDSLIRRPEEFIARVRELDYTDETFRWGLEHCDAGGLTGAVAELVARRMSRGGLRKKFGWSRRLRGGRPGDENAWITYKGHLPHIAERLRCVRVECMPAIELVREYDAEDVLFYLDPPYVPSTRKCPNVYGVEMTEQDHVLLAEALNQVRGKVLLSGYQSDLYNRLYQGWNMDCRVVANHSGQNKVKQKRIEVLWYNYER